MSAKKVFSMSILMLMFVVGAVGIATAIGPDSGDDAVIIYLSASHSRDNVKKPGVFLVQSRGTLFVMVHGPYNHPNVPKTLERVQDDGRQ